MSLTVTEKQMNTGKYRWARVSSSESVRANRMGCNSNSERNHARSFFDASTVRTSIRELSPVAKNSITSSDMAPTEDIRAKFGRFRILVVGRANAGKTTLLQRVCNTTEKPEIFDRKGKKVNPTFCATSDLPTDQS